MVEQEFEVTSHFSWPAIDGITPATTLEPETGTEVAETLSEARASRKAVIPVGGGTMIDVGDHPARYDIALSTRRLSGIVEHSPGDLTVVVRAGTTMQELNEQLAKHGQFVPLQPAFPKNATVGGVLAAALSGPWRQAYGSARDFTIGMRMALPSGQMAKSGGKVVKNVAGYDLAKLFIGSYGSLGVITEVAFKVYPLPAERLTVTMECRDLADAFPLAREVAGLGPGVMGVAATAPPALSGDQGPRWRVTVMLGGTAGTVRDLESAVRSAAGQRRVSEPEAEDALQSLVEAPGKATMRVSTLPTEAARALADLPVESAVSYPSIGSAYVVAPEITADEVRTARERLLPNGQLLLLHVSGGLRRSAGTWGPPGPDFALMRRVKEIFDPEGVMSPGRFVGGL
jgi:glycolate oxidase FAD binding subunit